MALVVGTFAVPFHSVQNCSSQINTKNTIAKMKISELQEKLFLIANTHGNLNIFISDPSEDFYEPRHLEDVTLRESDTDIEGYPHVQLHYPY